MVTWSTLNVASGRVDVIECYPSLEDWIKDASLLAWEDPNPRAVDYVTSDQTGEVVAVCFFGPESELYIMTFDGRHLMVEMPESYREV